MQCLLRCKPHRSRHGQKTRQLLHAITHCTQIRHTNVPVRDGHDSTDHPLIIHYHPRLKFQESSGMTLHYFTTTRKARKVRACVWSVGTSLHTSTHRTEHDLHHTYHTDHTDHTDHMRSEIDLSDLKGVHDQAGIDFLSVRRVQGTAKTETKKNKKGVAMYQFTRQHINTTTPSGNFPMTAIALIVLVADFLDKKPGVLRRKERISMTSFKQGQRLRCDARRASSPFRWFGQKQGLEIDAKQVVCCLSIE